ncbi:carbohydrate sulfotransferase 12-like [Pangasianodon hypophthalmus]|uniref:carbohydrate sulfotransferase 12-like n=1 Tax=Pangasianodon hypophthalmus TaxID=310915 RepID=UPI00147C959F|nr:carbohydrate sulfotransferase 12-like [Pangasianodon hypophthalmus]
MDKYKKFCFFFVLTMSLISFLFVINRETEDVLEGYLHHMTHFLNSEIIQQLDTDENRRCEGKIHTSPMPLNLKLRQYARKKLVHDLCINNITLDISGKWQTFDQIPLKDLSNLLVDDRHGIIYCYVPKVACTAWKRILIVLSESLKVDGVPYRSPADVPIEKVHGSSLKYLNAYPKAVMKKKLETYKKFMFVRDPFVRLISAYRDKFQSKNQVYYKSVGMHILRTFGNVSNLPSTVEKAHAAGIIPSFYNFIQFILSLQAKKDAFFDEHWQQINHLCHPCLIEYDFIGKMETIEEDAAQLLRMFHVDNIVDLRPWINSKTEPSAIKTWFSNIPVEWRRKLYKIYEADFRLFGYKNHENLDNLDTENII